MGGEKREREEDKGGVGEGGREGGKGEVRGIEGKGLERKEGEGGDEKGRWSPL